MNSLHVSVGFGTEIQVRQVTKQFEKTQQSLILLRWSPYVQSGQNFVEFVLHVGHLLLHVVHGGGEHVDVAGGHLEVLLHGNHRRVVAVHPTPGILSTRQTFIQSERN